MHSSDSWPLANFFTSLSFNLTVSPKSSYKMQMLISDYIQFLNIVRLTFNNVLSSAWKLDCSTKAVHIKLEFDERDEYRIRTCWHVFSPLALSSRWYLLKWSFYLKCFSGVNIDILPQLRILPQTPPLNANFFLTQMIGLSPYLENFLW